MAKWGNTNIAFRDKEVGDAVDAINFISAYNYDGNYTDRVNGYNATAFNSADIQDFAPEFINDYARFRSALKSYISIPYNSDFDFSATTNSKPFTISMWVYFETDKSSWFFNKRDTTQKSEIQLFYFNGDFRIQIFDAQRIIDTGSNSFIQSTFTPQTSVLNRWIHLVAAFDGQQFCQLYVDKVAATDFTNTNSFQKIKNFNQPIVKGNAAFNSNNSTLALNGRIDEDYLCNNYWTQENVNWAYKKGINGNQLI